MIVFIHIVFSEKKNEIEKTYSMYEAHETCITNYIRYTSQTKQNLLLSTRSSE